MPPSTSSSARSPSKPACGPTFAGPGTSASTTSWRRSSFARSRKPSTTSSSTPTPATSWSAGRSWTIGWWSKSWTTASASRPTARRPRTATPVSAPSPSESSSPAAPSASAPPPTPGPPPPSASRSSPNPDPTTTPGDGGLAATSAHARRGSGTADPARCLRLEVRVEERHDPLAGVLGRRLMVAGGPGEPAHHYEDERAAVSGALVVVEERVPGVRVLLDVVVHTKRRKHPVELLCGAPIGLVLGAIAGDDRAGTRQHALGIGVLRGPHAVVHAGRREPVSGGQQQREPATDAKTDDSDPAGARFLAGQPEAHGLHVLERPSPPGAQIAADGAQAGHRPAPIEEVGRHRQVA